jgi:hypothetical protein
MGHYRQFPISKVSGWFGGDIEAAGLWVLLMTDARCGPCGCYQVSPAEVWGELCIDRQLCLDIIARMPKHVMYRDRWVGLAQFQTYQGKGPKWTTAIRKDAETKEPPKDLLSFASGAPIDTLSIPYRMGIPQEQEQEQHQEQKQEQDPPSPTDRNKDTAIVVDAWRESWSAPNYKTGWQDTQAILQAMSEGWTVDQLCDSVRGWVNDPWEDRRQHCSIGRLLKDSEAIQKGIFLGEKKVKPETDDAAHEVSEMEKVGQRPMWAEILDDDPTAPVPDWYREERGG